MGLPDCSGEPLGHTQSQSMASVFLFFLLRLVVAIDMYHLVPEMMIKKPHIPG